MFLADIVWAMSKVTGEYLPGGFSDALYLSCYVWLVAAARETFVEKGYDGRFTGSDLTNARLSLNGVGYGVTNYAYNGQVGSGGGMGLGKIPDGTSNTVLFAERMGHCMGVNFPRPGATPNLASTSFTFSIWARGPWVRWTSQWIDGVTTNSNAWWDNPVFDSPTTPPRGIPGFAAIQTVRLRCRIARHMK